LTLGDICCFGRAVELGEEPVDVVGEFEVGVAVGQLGV